MEWLISLFLALLLVGLLVRTVLIPTVIDPILEWWRTTQRKDLKTIPGATIYELRDIEVGDYLGPASDGQVTETGFVWQKVFYRKDAWMMVLEIYLDNTVKVELLF